MEGMTERKPVEDTFESWVDKQIREATERGEFEGLRGAGEPIPGAGSGVEEHWWIRNYLRREGVPADGLLPESLMLRRDRERLAEQVGDCATEAEVRAEVSALNRRIVAWIRTPTPPLVPLAPADADDVVEAWRAARARTAAARPRAATRGDSRPPVREHTGTGGEAGWWQRMLRALRRR